MKQRMLEQIRDYLWSYDVPADVVEQLIGIILFLLVHEEDDNAL